LDSFQDIWWPSWNACWANFDLSRRQFFKLNLCSPILTDRCLPVSPTYLLRHSPTVWIRPWTFNTE
jgi:hypothetical protein